MTRRNQTTENGNVQKKHNSFIIFYQQLFTLLPLLLYTLMGLIFIIKSSTGNICNLCVNCEISSSDGQFTKEENNLIRFDKIQFTAAKS